MAKPDLIERVLGCLLLLWLAGMALGELTHGFTIPLLDGKYLVGEVLAVIVCAWLFVRDRTRRRQ